MAHLSSTMPSNVIRTSPAAITIVEGAQGPAQRYWLKKHMDTVEGRRFAVSCDFDTGGPWAGVSDLFSMLLPEIQRQRADLLERHSLELLHLLPQLNSELKLRNQTLTDEAPANEKVRNYAADRAFRDIQGLIDLLDEWKATAEPDACWIIACDNFDLAGKMNSHFFRELARRGERMRLSLVLAIAQGKAQEVRAVFPDGLSAEIIHIDVQPGDEPETPANMDIGQIAEELERKVGTDPIQSRLCVPDLITFWEMAKRPEKVIHWKFYAMSKYLHLGLYEDALRYGRGLLAMARKHEPSNVRLHSWIVIKILNGLTGIQDAKAALRFVHEEAAEVIENAPVEMQGDILYLIAMLYARYTKPRDLAKGEEYLESALAAIKKANLPEEQFYFQYVFNRNGLAMIRSFQKRYDEALELCINGLEKLKVHVPADKHHLHRSVLVYNIAQVYAAMNDIEHAVDYYSTAIELDPNYSEYYNERGSLYFRLGLLEKAQADYFKAIELSPPYFEVFTNLGQCYREMGAMQEAVHAYSRALDLQPDVTLALLGRAQAHDVSGNKEQAVVDYTAALAIDPGQWEALASIGVISYELGNLSKALDCFDRAIELEQAQSDLYQNRAMIYSTMERYSDALGDLKTAIALSQSTADVGGLEEQMKAMELKILPRRQQAAV